MRAAPSKFSRRHALGHTPAPRPRARTASERPGHVSQYTNPMAAQAVWFPARHRARAGDRRSSSGASASPRAIAVPVVRVSPRPDKIHRSFGRFTICLSGHFLPQWLLRAATGDVAQGSSRYGHRADAGLDRAWPQHCGSRFLVDHQRHRVQFGGNINQIFGSSLRRPPNVTK